MYICSLLRELLVQILTFSLAAKGWCLKNFWRQIVYEIVWLQWVGVLFVELKLFLIIVLDVHIVVLRNH